MSERDQRQQYDLTFGPVIEGYVASGVIDRDGLLGIVSIPDFAIKAIDGRHRSDPEQQTRADRLRRLAQLVISRDLEQQSPYQVSPGVHTAADPTPGGFASTKNRLPEA